MTVLVPQLIGSQRQTVFTPQTFELIAHPDICRSAAIEISFDTLKLPDQFDLDLLSNIVLCERSRIGFAFPFMHGDYPIIDAFRSGKIRIRFMLCRSPALALASRSQSR
jgi:hypothetical protein